MRRKPFFFVEIASVENLKNWISRAGFLSIFASRYTVTARERPHANQINPRVQCGSAHAGVYMMEKRQFQSQKTTNRPDS
jgi:hypothetical protein